MQMSAGVGAAAAQAPDAGADGKSSAAANTSVTLRGSTEIVTEFFGYGVNSILFQRGIYPPESFTRVSKYGLTMLVSKDDALKKYLNAVLQNVGEWLHRGDVRKLVVVISSLDSNRVLERWAFDVEMDENARSMAAGANNNASSGAGVSAGKSEKLIAQEIQAVIRQITSSVTFLPLLSEPCSFDLLVYTSKDLVEGADWEQSDPRLIKCAQNVRLRGFSTNIHSIDTNVAYAVDDDAM
ncbi:Mitotic spindle assembly checkpoint protein MAD2A [Porphyridium purpureum]|uniref:Mitotic spindle assembly checkpoint protein MAD2A n=1 Tax=Porphyridium purpureum TaxID=35688 RepID=A0A5J4YQ31_PORPP|nr:Mitotic spindle assembly checkpoint protein MAD2A [Porphyridium purpureum]|eukprot:POR4776..scf222_8